MVTTLSLFFEKASILGLAKRDLWGLGAESWFVVASYPFAKIISPLLNLDYFVGIHI